jgi:hypothetical protein
MLRAEQGEGKMQKTLLCDTPLIYTPRLTAIGPEVAGPSRGHLTRPSTVNQRPRSSARTLPHAERPTGGARSEPSPSRRRK